MRPIKVEFQAFGPYAGYESVDFEDIASKGLFLICGKTGIGKTMIIDAMTFALFGKSSGSGRDDFEAMRCTRAEFEKATFVRFEFENNGSYYRFERRLERGRKNLSPSRDVSRKGADGAWHTQLENARERDMNAMAEEIIGLSYDQFRQVIVLPQGQFEKLLTSDSKEKEAILTSIFGVEKWKGIADRFYEEADERRRRLTGAKERIRSSLAEEGCETIGELKARVEDGEKQHKALDEAYAEAGWDERIDQLTRLLATARRFADLHAAEAAVAGYEAQREERKRWGDRAEGAGRAERIRTPMSEVRSADQTVSRRRKEEEKATETLDEKKEAAGAAEEALKAHREREMEIAALKEKKTLCENSRDKYRELSAAEEELKAREKEAAAADREEAKAREEMAVRTKALGRLKEEYDRLDAEHRKLLDGYLAGITGELARELKDGEPCPVCGSTTHPCKAEASAGSVSEEDVRAKKKEQDAKHEQVTSAGEAQEKAKGVVEEKRKAKTEAETARSVAGEKLKGLRSNLIEGIGTLDELKKTIDDLERAIVAFAEEGKRLEDAERTAKEELDRAKAAAESAARERTDAEKVRTEAEANLDVCLKAQGFAAADEAMELMLDPEEAEALNRRIADFDAELKAAKESLAGIREELEGTPEQNEAEIREKIEEANRAKESYVAEVSRLTGETERLREKAKKLAAEGEGLEDRIREAEDDVAFARKLRGDTGTGLQRYVLGVMFSSVVAEANRMLELVHGGRYRLFRTDEKGKGNKRGLELKVHDKNSDEHGGRFVGTLSGGEKFLAALALSIGMAGVARKTGIRIDALFIDEGFGTLDEESIGDAMNVLNSIQQSNGLVGIISHMQILQDNIPTKLRVEAGEKGSRIIHEIG